MAKIKLDKYYTHPELAEYVVKKASEVLGSENITEYLEPSAGQGVFLPLFDKPYQAFDIEPDGEGIKTQDYLKIDLPYKQGRCVIGNPPFGESLSLAKKFFKKAITQGDYVVFILPISQKDNTNSMYEFDLIHSEDLGVREYSDRSVHCVLNIYRRNPQGLNKKRRVKLKSVEIVRQDSKNYEDFEHDFRMCYWGNSCAGKILKPSESYAAEYKIKVDPKFLDSVRTLLTNVDWRVELNCVAMLKIQQFHIINLLKRKIKGIC